MNVALIAASAPRTAAENGGSLQALGRSGWVQNDIRGLGHRSPEARDCVDEAMNRRGVKQQDAGVVTALISYGIQLIMRHTSFQLQPDCTFCM